MPYISKINREFFINDVDNTVKLICEEPDLVIQGEYLACFLDKLRCNFCNIDITDGDTSGIFDTEFLEIFKVNQLYFHARNCTDNIFRNNNILDQAGELNYIMSAVAWGILGDSIWAKPAKYGFRAWIKGVIESIYLKVGKDNSRRTVMIRSVISDVILELNRRKTSVYEDQKMEENGDIWPLKSFNYMETIPSDIVNSEFATDN